MFLFFTDIDGNITEPVLTTEKQIWEPNTIPKEQVKAHSNISTKSSIINTINTKPDNNGLNKSKAVERKVEDKVTENKTNQGAVSILLYLYFVN